MTLATRIIPCGAPPPERGRLEGVMGAPIGQNAPEKRSAPCQTADRRRQPPPVSLQGKDACRP